MGFAVERTNAQSRDRFDVPLECSGATGVFSAGLYRRQTNGRAAMIGMPKQPVELPLSSLNVNELTIALVNRYRHTWPTGISLIEGGRVDVRSLTTHRFALAESEEPRGVIVKARERILAVFERRYRRRFEGCGSVRGRQEMSATAVGLLNASDQPCRDGSVHLTIHGGLLEVEFLADLLERARSAVGEEPQKTRVGGAEWAAQFRKSAMHVKACEQGGD